MITASEARTRTGDRAEGEERVKEGDLDEGLKRARGLGEAARGAVERGGEGESAPSRTRWKDE